VPNYVTRIEINAGDFCRYGYWQMQKTLKFPANAFEDLQRSGLLPLAPNELRALRAARR
jgi:hypothetical protein